MWKEVIELGKVTEDIVHGEPVQTLVYKEVYANKKSVRYNEFYQAAMTGLKPELVFEVHSFEYDNEDKVRYNNKEYSIIRTYEKGEVIEITVSSFIGKGA